MPQHDHFEELCALALSGQLSADESKRLDEHATMCASCRTMLSRFQQIVVDVLPEVGVKHFPVKVPGGMRDRFVARAHSEGLLLAGRITEKTKREQLWRAALTWQVAVATAALMIGILFLEFVWKVQIAKPTVVFSKNWVSDDVLRDNTILRDQLRVLQAEVENKSRALETEKHVLESAKDAPLQSSGHADDLRDENARLRRDLAEHETELAQLKADLEALASTKAANDFMVQAEQSDINTLRAKVASLTEELNESQQLSAAANQAKELIVARNLHIIDVHDNANGARPKPFGRIFYTEGQKLLFYAYDLGDSQKLSAKVSFYVWGEKAGATQKARNLGILRSENAHDGRWVVTFDDPRVLTQINTVFVTVESSTKTIREPHGNRILVAFLDGEANHP